MNAAGYGSGPELKKSDYEEEITMKIFGHRGFSGEYPENTMLAFRKAVEAGADGIELDVQLTKDLVPVIMHDELVDRTSSGTGYIRDFICEEIEQLDCSYPDRFQGKYGVQKIPTLEEYLVWMKEEAVNIVTNIELKNNIYYYGGMEKKVIEMVRRYGLEKRIILSSFNGASVVECKRKDDSIECGFLVGRYLENAGVYARMCGVEYYHPNLEFLTEQHVKNCSENGVGVNVYTVNEEEDMRRMKKWGVNTIITNFPDRGRRIADERCV